MVSERVERRERERNIYFITMCIIVTYQRGNSKLISGSEMSPGEWVN